MTIAMTEQKIKELEEIAANYDKRQYESRRLRIVDVAMQDVVSLFQANNDADRLLIGLFPKLPKDYRVISADFWFARHTLGFLIWSIEFSSVPLGKEIPRLGYSQPNHVSTEYRKNEKVNNFVGNDPIDHTNPSSPYYCGVSGAGPTNG